MCDAYNDETVSRKLKILFHSSGIEQRHSVLPDFGRSEKTIFAGENRPDVEQRMQVYQRNASDLAVRAVQNSISNLNERVNYADITHLITVTCTGMYAPGPDTEIMEKLGLQKNIERFSVNFTGCNAAFPALKIADKIVKADKNSKVLVVCFELCTLHFQPKNDHNNLLSNTIFSDGAAAALIVSNHEAEKQKLPGFTIRDFHSVLLNNGKKLMQWHIKPINFEMVLNAKVPGFIGENINQLISECKQKFNISPPEIGQWAVHPGGRKIVDEVKKQLNISPEKIEASYRVLKTFGNMSSPTILFVLNDLLQNGRSSGEKIFAVGFGPGISVDTALMTYEQ